MTEHDRGLINEAIGRYWVHYDEGQFDILASMLTEDCHTSSRTELGTHPHEAFIASDNRGRDAVLAWKKHHRGASPYPLRHNATNSFVTAERGDEVDVTSYLLVTVIADRKPALISSGFVHWTLVRTASGYRVRAQHTVLDSIESAPFTTVESVAERAAAW